MGRFVCDFYSYSLQREISLTVLIPTLEPEEDGNSHRIQARFPVLYFIHGSGNDGSTAARYTSIERYAQEYKIGIVMFSHEDKCGRTLQARIPDHPSGLQTRLENFEALIQQELPEFLSSYFPLCTDRDHSYIAGLSQGGYIALNQTLQHPELFSAAGIFSGMFFSRSYLAALARMTPAAVRAIPEQEISANLFPEFGRLLAQTGTANIPKLFFSCGDREMAIRTCSDAMAKLLAQGGADVYCAPGKAYGHEWDNWDLSLREFLEWIPRSALHKNV